MQFWFVIPSQNAVFKWESSTEAFKFNLQFAEELFLFEFFILNDWLICGWVLRISVRLLRVRWRYWFLFALEQLWFLMHLHFTVVPSCHQVRNWWIPINSSQKIVLQWEGRFLMRWWWLPQLTVELGRVPINARWECEFCRWSWYVI